MKRNSVAFDLNKSNLGKLVLVYLSLLIAFLISNLAQASSYECSLVRQLSDRLSCGYGVGGVNVEAQPIPDNQFLVSSDFGPSLCKAKEVLDPVRKDLKAECEAWMKARKSDLGTSYLTGTCEEKQDACTGGLVRLTVRGSVHYSRPAVTK